MRGRTVNRLHRAALVDRHVDDDRTRTHFFDHFRGDELRCFRARNQYRTDHDVRFFDGLRNVERVRRECMHASAEDVIQLTQTVEVVINNGDDRAHADRHFRRVRTYRAATDDGDFGRLYAGNAAH